VRFRLSPTQKDREVEGSSAGKGRLSKKGLPFGLLNVLNLIPVLPNF
jgi:hypothetical protein